LALGSATRGSPTARIEFDAWTPNSSPGDSDLSPAFILEFLPRKAGKVSRLEPRNGALTERRLFWLRGLQAAVALTLLAVLTGCGINTIPTLEEQAKATWSQVQNQYQRRAELIPNLVEIVLGYAKQEREVLTQVIEARAKATQIQVNADQLTDPEAIKRFQDAQSQLSGALGRLIALAGEARLGVGE
jgi:hypothetical protein